MRPILSLLCLALLSCAQAQQPVRMFPDVEQVRIAAPIMRWGCTWHQGRIAGTATEAHPWVPLCGNERTPYAARAAAQQMRWMELYQTSSDQPFGELLLPIDHMMSRCGYQPVTVVPRIEGGVEYGRTILYRSPYGSINHRALVDITETSSGATLMIAGDSLTGLRGC